MAVTSLMDSLRNWRFFWGGARNDQRRTREEYEAETMFVRAFAASPLIWAFATQICQLHRLINSLFIFSSGVLDTSERDSARKTRWNSAINEPDQTSASSSSEYSPSSTLKKSTKSRNEATLLFRFVGDINILVTPLILEALQRFVAKPLQFALFCFLSIRSL